MEREEFYAALCKTENELEHSAKGTTWSKKDHKYLKKIGDTYIYTKDQLKDFVDTKVTGKTYRNQMTEAGLQAAAAKHQAKNDAGIANQVNSRSNKPKVELFNNRTLVIDNTLPTKEDVRKAIAKANASSRAAKSYQAQYDVAQSRYYKKSLKGIAEATISKGKKWLSNLIANAKKTKSQKLAEQTKKAIAERETMLASISATAEYKNQQLKSKRDRERKAAKSKYNK